jgi:aryl-alcohol dehydrogenase-like predicted oxidoreductase
MALRWVIDHPAVSTVIPGARNPEQARDNAAAAGLPALDERTNEALGRIYDELVREYVHARW